MKETVPVEKLKVGDCVLYRVDPNDPLVCDAGEVTKVDRVVGTLLICSFVDGRETAYTTTAAETLCTLITDPSIIITTLVSRVERLEKALTDIAAMNHKDLVTDGDTTRHRACLVAAKALKSR